MKIKAIFEINKDKYNFSDLKFNYQKDLTKKLDNTKSDFNQNILNEIVLWKVNRYAKFDDETILLLNKIKNTDTSMDIKLTKEILIKLLDKKQKGVRLAMASTILRFKNPNIYQIIDQRMYRIIYGENFKNTNNLNTQIEIYLNYLKKLKEVCFDYKINFLESDRKLYELDRIHNKGIKLSGY